ncbi:hypothetical protein ACJMK2_039377 [Sinanodonta woodiana]|uniref:Laminin subunit gamma-1 n=1 Tax=Sinanodonta woodiana TaxID=1069815 RepID=A0ABD3WF91_SINWO
MAVGRRAELSERTFRSFGQKFVLPNMKVLALFVLIGHLPHLILGQNKQTNCYDNNGKAQRCVPVFENAAFNLPVEATNTCGLSRPTEFCLQTGVTGVRESCGHVCDARDPLFRHPAQYMTDYDSPNNYTWWQSETMLERPEWLIHRQQNVNLTIDLRKQYDVTYIRLKFYSPRPESFALYKRTTADGPWIAYQYYSASCESTYGLPRRGIVSREREDVAVCTDEYSDISPLTAGQVPFSTLEGRPSSTNFENSLVLQEWVTATQIKIVLTRMNTFGDEIFGDPRVLRSYFFSVTDIAVGARCKCNGHGGECYEQLDQNLDRELVCHCEHNTHGKNCEECKPFYNDRPWGRASENDAHECQPCDCKGMSEECYFDEELFRQTGHGGHCKNCRNNTDGPHCERCKVNHYVDAVHKQCVPCGCDPIGSENLQCDTRGQCPCKPGVTGQRCSQCQDNYYDFGPYGCRECGCLEDGSLNNQPYCNPVAGMCTCKEHVEGQDCDRCKPGYFSLDRNNPYGCISCFCYGHSSICNSASGYYTHAITTDFETGKQRWTAEDRSNNAVETQYNGILQNLGVSAPSGTDMVYFVAPSRYLGDHKFSYNQYLTYKLRIGEEAVRPSIVDIVIQSGGQQISAPFYAQNNPEPGIEVKEYRFRLHENPDYQWYPQLTSEGFISILSNITAIKIRATYNREGVGFIDDIKLETARRGLNGGSAASWIEQCTCPDGYVGQFCESCAPGYRREPAFGGPFAICIPCQCYNHSDQCDPQSGRCICKDNTIGDNCERCAEGFYGNARDGTTDDCKPCPCPSQGPCIQLPDKEVVCTQCPEGSGGSLCDLCLDGYFGDPKGWYGDEKSCLRCNCSDNIDPNAVGNCDRITGECKKCIHNTGGFHCESCLPNYYGDALTVPRGQCKACLCYPPGTISAGILSCDPASGQCPCKPNVIGRMCNQCQSGYWNLNSGQGCEACLCDPTGSLNTTCNEQTGQCICKPGVTGLKCDKCQRFFYGFSQTGCQACNCDPEGSLDMQCDEYGFCPCREGVEGQRCDRCQENKYNITAGCIDCPPCYSLVQERVSIHRGKLRELNNLIINIGNDPTVFNDTAFLTQMNSVNDSVNILLDDARGASAGGGSLGQQLQMLRKSIEDVLQRCAVITRNIVMAKETSESSLNDIMTAEEAIERAEQALKAAKNYIDSEGLTALQRAKQALDSFGQQSKQMTDIANQAKELSRRQVEEAKRIHAVAGKALNTSREALQLAKETLTMPGGVMQEIQVLQQKAANAQELYKTVQFLAEKARNASILAYQEALDLYTEATSIQIPGVDVNRLMAEAAQIKKEAANIKAEAKRLIEENQKLLSDIKNEEGNAEKLLESGYNQQQRADELLAEVDAARAQAGKAVRMGDKTLKEANETLQILQGFNQLVKESKGKADDALEKAGEIEDKIEEAEKLTLEAKNALSGAESDANNALSIAQQAQKTAEDASEEASTIRQDATKTKQRAVELKDETDTLEDQVQDTKDQIDNYSVKTDADEKLAMDALKKAGEAKQSSQDAANKVADALSKVVNISSILASLYNLDTEELDRLEQELSGAEEALRTADLDTQLSRLSAANVQVKDWVNDYMIDIKQLEADVENVREIMEALPDGCFKNIELENVGK